MVALGRTLIAVFIIFLLLAAILIGGSIGGFLGSGYMIVAAILVIVLWGIFAAFTMRAIFLANALANGSGDSDGILTLANRLFVIATILSPLTGLALAFLAFVGCGPLWLSSLYHWGGMVGTILAFLAFFLLPVIVRACVGGETGFAAFHYWAWVVFMPLMVASIWGTVWLIPYLLLKGDIKESEYSSATRVYKLPFPGGESSWVIQGNNSSLNHNNDHNGQKYSWDFRRRCGTPVLAAHDGTILKVTDGNDGMGGDNNEIQVSEGVNGPIDYYLHIQKDSAKQLKIAVGATVHQGDQIAKVGSVGNSMTGHIHFMVKKDKNSPTIAVSFADVSEDKGIPRTFHSYTSGNRRVP
jgi:hypothetical protein